MFFVWKEATSRLTKWPTGEMNEMKNSYTYKPWIVDVGVDFDLVLGSMLMLKICFDVVDGNCDAYNMIMVMLCLWQFSSLSYREPILGKWGWHLGLYPLCSKKPRQALLLMTVVSRQMTSWWIIPCLVEQTAPMLVLADTVDFSSPHQGVSGNDTLAKLRPVFVLHVTRNCSVSPLFVFNNCCQIDGARAVPWGQANTNGANRRFLETESPSSD